MADTFADPFAEPPAPAPPKKKSLFNRPIPKPAVQDTEDDQAVDFFRRSREVFPRHILEQQRKRAKKAARQENKRSSTSVDRKEDSPPQEKKRRISSHSALSSDEDTRRTRKRSSQSTPPSRDSQKSLNKDSQSSPTTLSGRYSKELQSQTKDRSRIVPEVHTLTDDDTEDENETYEQPLSARKQSTHVLTIDDDDYPASANTVEVSDDEGPQSDNEYAELLQQAKERKRQKLAEQNAGKIVEQRNHISQSHDTVEEDVFRMDEPKKDADPVLEILVTSHIDGSKPLIAKRRLKSRLLEVKKSWCDKQSLDGQPMFPSVEAKNCVFLTYRGKRLYDSTACSSLGLEIDAEGRVLDDTEGDINGRVHLYAWTAELFDQYQRNQEKKRLGVEEEEHAQPEVQETRIRVTLKSKNHGEHKLKAREAITFEQIAAAFRKDKQIPETQEITLQIDGDTLDPDMSIGDSEVEDMDVIEVHIR